MESKTFPNFEKRGGLIIVVVQDATTLEVLMHAFMNLEALKMTLQTGEFWRWSTEHSDLQYKGATSNSVMKVKSILADCDGDAVLIQVEVTGTGYACHLKRHSCFSPIDSNEILSAKL